MSTIQTLGTSCMPRLLLPTESDDIQRLIFVYAPSPNLKEIQETPVRALPGSGPGLEPEHFRRVGGTRPCRH